MGAVILLVVLTVDLGTKENLDLPFDAVGESEEEENAPEIVTFYGQQLEGDTFIYVIDRSSSMQQGELMVAKREVIRNIREFSSRVTFGIIFFDIDFIKFPANGYPIEATPVGKAAGVAFVAPVRAGRKTCHQQPLVAGLQMANLASSRRKCLVFLSDGGATCDDRVNEDAYRRQTLNLVAAYNYEHVQINCIGVLNPSPPQESFLKALSSQNNGTYVRISH